jgi:hypothetical protein
MTRQKIGPALSVLFALAANQAGACGLTPADINANWIKQIAEEIGSGQIDSAITSAPECKRGELQGNPLIVSTPVVVGDVKVLLDTIITPMGIHSQATTPGARLPSGVDLRPLEPALRARAARELQKLLEQCPARSQSAGAFRKLRSRSSDMGELAGEAAAPLVGLPHFPDRDGEVRSGRSGGLEMRSVPYQPVLFRTRT